MHYKYVAQDLTWWHEILIGNESTNINNMDMVHMDMQLLLKLMFSKKATKIDEIFNADLTLRSKCQIDSEDFVNFCGLLRKHEL